MPHNCRTRPGPHLPNLARSVSYGLVSDSCLPGLGVDPRRPVRKHGGLRVNLHLQYLLRLSKVRVLYFATMEPALRRGIGIPSSSSSPRDARKRTPPSLSDCTNVFVVAPDSEQTLCEIPANLVVDPFRQKRLHHKSKRGCLQCRKRRVKVS